MINEGIKTRKGARKVQKIPADVLDLLNKGEIETVNLTEWLGVNQIELITSTFPEMGLDSMTGSIIQAVKEQKKPSAMKSIKIIGEKLFQYNITNKSVEPLFKILSEHKSNTVRCYATYLVALYPNLDIAQKLDRSRILIADRHFGVREVVWMALRPEIEKI